MAKDKKSFILYCDYIHTFSELPDEFAGKLIKHIFEYVNDKNPQSDDWILKSAFNPIKQQLKRDLKKYEKIQERNRANGSLGGRPKKTQKNLKNPVGYFGNPENPEKPDTVTVNDNDIYIINKKINSILQRFSETSYQQNEIIYKTNKDELTKHLKRFLEIKKDSEDFFNKPYGNVISWFWNWCNSTSKPKETNNNNTAAPWIEGYK
tara:strand:+ start:22464 stop:23084 length:621 start_codon:yes stop_codon:yes gene_type:complete